MKTQQEIQELAGSLVNGNRSYVREELRNALPFELLEFIEELSFLYRGEGDNPVSKALYATKKLLSV